jgi:ATP-dependent protease ClpP protease subunit
MSRRNGVRAASNPDEPYGDVEYADPGYQEDGKKRYPIDTEEHVRAAWSYINQEDNASKYTPDQLSKIKARIKAAAKKFGIEIADNRLKVTRPLARLEKGQTDWYRVSNLAGQAPEIYIYDEIGYWGTASNDFVKDLALLADEPRLVINMNSPGGDVFDGIAIYQALLDHPAEVVVKVNGLAASIASVIAMAGDRVIMGARSQIMIHEGFTFASGDSATMRKTADMLDRISDNIAAVYADRAGGDQSMWRDRMREETWFSAEEAVAAGLADEIEGRKQQTVQDAFDMSVYKYSGREEAPEPVKNEAPEAKPQATVESKVEPEFEWDFAAFKSSLKEGIRG